MPLPGLGGLPTQTSSGRSWKGTHNLLLPGGRWGPGGGASGDCREGVSGATAARGQGGDTEQAEGAYCCFTNCKAATASGLLAPSHPSGSFAKHSCVYVATQGVLCESGIQRASMS
jgi:hypothetical protein